ncbi:hypothetical protein [Actinocorallia sp. A-T 12471]|uniref:hypothetical protein n=1 Tax=Actinocorallia sp. A-T 12471 TaxID=3089813 RepID=UPI0029CE9131|nr:hypothetical protein [Actinocorallia sp. A-T 12471]MDX6738187.1 hypothetical protein [Actinocorallia sp. A-T 12471]
MRAQAKERGLKPTAYLREIVEASVGDEDEEGQGETRIPVTALRAFLNEYVGEEKARRAG